jgi:hypothetical protein
MRRLALVLAGSFVLATAPISGAVRAQCSQRDGFERLAAACRRDRRDVRDEGSPRRTALEAWDGPMHRSMVELAECAVRRRLARRDLVRSLGAADRVVKAGGTHQGIAVLAGQEHLIYWWRGGHDYLYFTVENGAVTGSDWWYAWE